MSKNQYSENSILKWEEFNVIIDESIYQKLLGFQPINEGKKK